MSDRRQTLAEMAQRIRANHASPEVILIVQWLGALEEEAVESLVACAAQDHDTCAAKVHVLRSLRKHITEPSFAERQAKYKVTQHGE